MFRCKSKRRRRSSGLHGKGRNGWNGWPPPSPHVLLPGKLGGQASAAGGRKSAHATAALRSDHHWLDAPPSLPHATKPPSACSSPDWTRCRHRPGYIIRLLPAQPRTILRRRHWSAAGVGFNVEVAEPGQQQSWQVPCQSQTSQDDPTKGAWLSGRESGIQLTRQTRRCLTASTTRAPPSSSAPWSSARRDTPPSVRDRPASPTTAHPSRPLR